MTIFRKRARRSFSAYAQDILNEPEEIVGVKGNTIPRKLSVDYISFSAHVDYSQNSEFIESIHAQHIVSHPHLIRARPSLISFFPPCFSLQYRCWYMASKLQWVG